MTLPRATRRDHTRRFGAARPGKDVSAEKSQPWKRQQPQSECGKCRQAGSDDTELTGGTCSAPFLFSAGPGEKSSFDKKLLKLFTAEELQELPSQTQSCRARRKAQAHH